MSSKHKRKRTNKISKLLSRILDSLKIVYEIVKLLKSIFELFHWLKKSGVQSGTPDFFDKFFNLSETFLIIYEPFTVLLYHKILKLQQYFLFFVRQILTFYYKLLLNL